MEAATIITLTWPDQLLFEGVLRVIAGEGEGDFRSTSREVARGFSATSTQKVDVKLPCDKKEYA